MAISINSGSNPLYVYYNGNQVSEVLYNGTHVWPDMIPPTPSGEIEIGYYAHTMKSQGGGLGYYSYNPKNQSSYFVFTNLNGVPYEDAQYDGSNNNYPHFVPFDYNSTETLTFKYDIEKEVAIGGHYIGTGDTFGYSGNPWFESQTFYNGIAYPRPCDIYVNGVLYKNTGELSNHNDCMAVYYYPNTGCWYVSPKYNYYAPSRYPSNGNLPEGTMIFSSLTGVKFYEPASRYSNGRLYLEGTILPKNSDITVTISNYMTSTSYPYYMTLSLPDSNGNYFTVRSSKTSNRPYTYGIDFDLTQDYRIYCVGTLDKNNMSSSSYVGCRLTTQYPVSSSSMAIGQSVLDFTNFTPYGLLSIYWNATDKKWYLEVYETEASSSDYTGVPGMTLSKVNFRLVQTIRMPDGYIQGAYKHGILVEPRGDINKLAVYMTPGQLFSIDEEV